MSTLKARLDISRGEHFRLRLDTEIPLTGVTAVYGPSGCGKTTLLAGLAGLLPGAGDSEVLFGQQVWQRGPDCLPAHQRNVGYVFQEARLFPHLDVAGNLDFAEQRCRSGRGPNHADVCSWLDLDELLERRVDELSRGQQQRVALARALLRNPGVLLLDEPLANIDLSGRADILRHLATLSRELDTPMVYVSHDMEELARLADSLLVLEAGELVAEGSMLELCSQLELALAHEEQAAAIVTAPIVGEDTEFGLTELSLESQPLFIAQLDRNAGPVIRLRIPARDVSLCLERPRHTSILNVFETRVDEIEESSDARVLVRLRLGEQFLLARLTRKSIAALSLQPGDQVFAQVKSVALLSDNHD